MPTKKKKKKKKKTSTSKPSNIDDQALQWMRDVCLALPNTSEGVHYGEIVFKVGPNMFASAD